jgi:hypothetical protein
MGEGRIYVLKADKYEVERERDKDGGKNSSIIFFQSMFSRNR